MADDKCRLARLFGDGDEKTLLFLEQWQPSDRADWLVAGPAVKHLRSTPIRYAFDPNGDSGEVASPNVRIATFGTGLGGKSTIVAVQNSKSEISDLKDPQLPGASIDSAAATTISEFSISERSGDTAIFEIGSLEKPLEAFNHCMTNLVGSWGVDPEAQRAIVQEVRFLNSAEVTRSVFSITPKEVIRNGNSSAFLIRAIVGKDGQTEACKVIVQSGVEAPKYMADVCETFQKKARFEAARDAEGVAIRSFYTSPLTITAR